MYKDPQYTLATSIIVLKNKWVFPLFFLGMLIFCAQGLFAQDNKQDIGTESVTVVKKVAPIILIGPKPLIAPLLKAARTQDKKTLNYQIKEFPVASNFSPQLAAPDAWPSEKAPKVYNSMLHLGLGSRSTAELWADSQIKQSRYAQLGIQLMHHSMWQDLPAVDWDSNFFNTELKGKYQYRRRKKQYEAGASFQHMVYSWYGHSQENTVVPLPLPGPFTDIQQAYFASSLYGSFQQDKGLIHSLRVAAADFRDATDSNAQKLDAAAHGGVYLGDAPLKWKSTYAYRSGIFSTPPLEDLTLASGLSYAFHKVALNPVIELAKADAFFQIGAQMVYSDNFKIYPDLYAHYPMITDMVLAFADLKGDYLLNDYASFVQENPFVAPALEVRPSDQRYALTLGVKGGGSVFSYELSWREQSTRDQALFVLNPENYFVTVPRQFNYGNSFRVVYDAIETQRLGVSFEWAPLSGLSLSGYYHRFSYETAQAAAAWHLPEARAAASLSYDFLKRFSLKAHWNYTGTRAAQSSQVVQFVQSGPMPTQSFTLDAFQRLDAQFYYQANERLKLFVKGTNLTNNTYALWSGFVAPPRIVMAGAQYQFNL